MDLTAFLVLVVGSLPFTALCKYAFSLLTSSGTPRGDAAKYIHYAATFLLTGAAYGMGLSKLPLTTCTDPIVCLAVGGTIASAVALTGGVVYDALKAFMGTLDDI